MWLEMLRQKLQLLGLSMGDIEHSHAFEGVGPGGLQSRVVVHLELENVYSLPQLAKDAPLTLYHAIQAQQGVPAVRSGSLLREKSIV